jgi:Arc/MetJ-type ribon-helix-helix transcriptional regulator
MTAAAAVGGTRWLGRLGDGMMVRRTAMPKAKVALTLDADLLERVDQLVARNRFKNRSQAIETALAEKLARLARTRLAEECAKLDPAEEQGLADEGLAATREAWPEY